MNRMELQGTVICGGCYNEVWVEDCEQENNNPYGVDYYMQSMKFIKNNITRADRERFMEKHGMTYVCSFCEFQYRIKRDEDELIKRKLIMEELACRSLGISCYDLKLRKKHRELISLKITQLLINRKLKQFKTLNT